MSSGVAQVGNRHVACFASFNMILHSNFDRRTAPRVMCDRTEPGGWRNESILKCVGCAQIAPVEIRLNKKKQFNMVKLLILNRPGYNKLSTNI